MIFFHRDPYEWALAWPGMIEIAYRRVGGIRFIKLGWLNLSWSVTHTQSAITAPAVAGFTE